MKRKLLTSVLTLGLLIPTTAFAEDNGSFKDLKLPAGQVNLNSLPSKFQNTLDKRSKEINDYFVNLQELKFEVEVANKELRKQHSNLGFVTTNTLSKVERINKELAYYEKNSLEIAGLAKVEIGVEDTIIQPFSTDSQASITKPTVYYDNDSLAYVASTTWQWNTDNKDINNTGRDGVGINVTQVQLSIFDSHVNTWDRNGRKYTPSKSSKASSYGYYLRFDDLSNGDTYSAHEGNSWMFFRFYNAKPVGKTLNFASRYNHTYSGRTIDSVTIGITDISLGFSSAGIDWEITEYSAIPF